MIIGWYRRLSGARIAGALLLSLASHIAQAEIWHGAVDYVHDGDTAHVIIDGERERVRLASIDAPELDQPYGGLSRDTLNDLIGGRDVRLEVSGRDSWGRPIADIYVQGSHINAVMVQRGMAWVWPRYNDSQRLEALGRWAESQDLGVFSQPNPIPPWEWRRNH